MFTLQIQPNLDEIQYFATYEHIARQFAGSSLAGSYSRTIASEFRVDNRVERITVASFPLEVATKQLGERIEKSADLIAKYPTVLEPLHKEILEDLGNIETIDDALAVNQKVHDLETRGYQTRLTQAYRR